MKKKSQYFALIISLLFVGCSPQIPATQPKISTPTINISQQPTISSMPPTALPEETATVSSNLPADSGKQCFGSEQSLPVSIEGEFVLGGDYDLYLPKLEMHHSPSYIWMSSTGDKIVLSTKTGEEIKDFSVSPNKKWLAYYTHQIEKSTSDRLIIVGNDGKLLKEYPEQNWWGLVGWVDDSRLLISKLAKINPFPTIIFDPFSGKGNELLPTYPDIYSGRPWMPFWEKYGANETIYNSKLDLIIYPKNPNQIILWDKNSQKTIAVINDPGASSSDPLWLMNGKDFVIDVAIRSDITNPYYEEIMRVSTNGDIKQLTNLVELYGSSDIRQLSESADGHYIAFWFRQATEPANGISPFQLAIYDTKKEITRFLCVQTITRVFTPIWAPTSDQLLVPGFLDTVDNYGTVFVDVDKGLLSLVEKDVIPVGWMSNPR